MAIALDLRAPIARKFEPPYVGFYLQEWRGSR